MSISMVLANAAGGSFCLQTAHTRRLAVVSYSYKCKWQEYTHFATFLQRFIRINISLALLRTGFAILI